MFGLVLKRIAAVCFWKTPYGKMGLCDRIRAIAIDRPNCILFAFWAEAPYLETFFRNATISLALDFWLGASHLGRLRAGLVQDLYWELLLETEARRRIFGAKLTFKGEVKRAPNTLIVDFSGGF